MISLKVVTPLGRYLEEEVKSIHAASVEGQFTLLPNHMPVVMALKPCKLVLVTADDQKQEYAIAGGFLHFDQNHAALLTDAIEGRAEIDIPRAQAAYKRARERLERIDERTNLRRAQLAMERAINRLQVTETHINH